MPLSPETRLGRYEILAPIGAGGMGEVYRATDTNLKREVALKILPEGMALEPDRLARFHREARSVAALNHPNVVTLYSVEHSDGIHFLTMELVAGQSLDHLIPPEGLAMDRIFEIAGALAEALAAAHDKGLVHRDLKPANIMITNEGRVKVLDFGLAKDVRTASPDDETLTSLGQTQVGAVMGTPPYMSPEQISGRTLDHRTDLFSLGIILYELTTGRRPFLGDTSVELAASILRDIPAPVSARRADIPEGLANLIQQCLAKAPGERIQSARLLAKGLQEARVQTTATSRITPVLPSAEGAFWVAVLPLKFTGGNPELAALADGLSEEIVSGLSRFSYLRVIAWGATLRYAGQATDLRTVGKELGARYVMDGSLRQAGPRLRVSVQLSDATTGEQLWAETYERAFRPETIFELQDDLAPRVVSTVADAYGVLPHSMSQAVRVKPREQLTPYEALLRSFSYAERVSAQEYASAKAALEQALQQSPGSSDCWAMLSILLTDGYIHGFDDQPGTLDRALAAALQAVDTGQSNHKAHQALAWALFFRKEVRASRNAAERTVALNSMDASAAVYMGQTIAFSGEWERGCALITRAIDLNPNHPGWYWYALFLDAYRRSEYQAALSVALKINMQGFHLTFVALAAAYGQLGEKDAARDAARQLVVVRPNYAAAGRQELSKIWDEALVEHLIDGLRKAGLEICPT